MSLRRYRNSISTLVIFRFCEAGNGCRNAAAPALPSWEGVNTVELRPSVRGELVEPPADRPFDKLRANGDLLKSTALGVRGVGPTYNILQYN